MLRIKRASAGSGKTYELAKTYIKLLITAKKNGYKRLLLKDESFRESLSSIMAVTFTVKATAEMKQRIVERLADLSRADSAETSELDEIPYLKEFVEDFKTDRHEIADLARKALRTLLLHYSDFKVQTIDSFFQSILHTFAYEASLDDNFNIELDADKMLAIGFDNALDQLSDSAAPAEDTLLWLRRNIEGDMNGNKWNVFAREGSKLYSKIIKEAKNLEKEDYKKIREVLIDYFDNLEIGFDEVERQIDDANLMIWKPYHDRRREKARILDDILTGLGLDSSALSNYASGPHKESLEDFNPQKMVIPSKEIVPRKGAKGAVTALTAKAEKGLRAVGVSPETLDDLTAAYEEWREAANDYWSAIQPRLRGVLAWLEYRRLIPNMMLVLDIARRKEAYLKGTNTLQMSDTTQILSRIIGDDDTPFIYERMGTKLNHFLIDEFQDTSRMQWENLRPLLVESEASDNENLIIGDAKQSIYRFRNADYTLIGSLENSFPNCVYYTQETPPDASGPQNTNFRSKPRVVEFNNYIFKNIVDLNTSKGDEVFPFPVREIYRDCIQAIPAGKLISSPERSMGYVEVNFYSPRSSDNDENGDERESPLASEPGFASLPERILELRERGYNFRDIAILVKSHKQGAAAIEAISAHNAACPERSIPVISEENLLVATSLAVRIVVNALRIAAGLPVSHTEPNPVISDPVDPDALCELLGSLDSLALPAVVEAVLATFVHESRRREEAPFIAAFQDAVIEWSMSHPSDIGSFLKWWDTKSKSLSITSPEDSEGVSLQTIHKAKGLEYKCVIIPQALFGFTPVNFKEWRWVAPDTSVEGSELLPPFVPVETRKELLNTVHAPEWTRYLEEFALDELNKMYVAFTRSADELYIYVPRSKNEEAKKSCGGTLGALLSEPEPPKGVGLLSEPFQISVPGEGSTIVTYGMPSTPGQIRADKEKELARKKKEGRESFPVGEYEVSLRPADRQRPIKTVLYPEGREEEIDPRAEGTLKHRVMQMVEKPSDLGKALRRLKAEGMVGDDRILDWEKELSEAIESVADRGWFAPDVRVFNERPLIVNDVTQVRRPDRFIVSPEGDATVIDYKFGIDRKGLYRTQVGEYADMLRRSGKFKSVRAFLWFVTAGDVEEVLP